MTKAVLNNTTSSTATLTLSNTLTVSASFSATASVSAEAVSAGVGFNVQGSWSWLFQASTPVPAHSCRTIKAYALVGVWSYDVWYNPLIGSDYKIGTGWASLPNGQRFDIVTC